jgi:hypothetical protein
MTMDEQAQRLEASYVRFHRQPWRTTEDRREALHTLRGQLRDAERCLQQPPTRDTDRARSKLILWCELTRATLTAP